MNKITKLLFSIVTITHFATISHPIFAFGAFETAITLGEAEKKFMEEEIARRVSLEVGQAKAPSFGAKASKLWDSAKGKFAHAVQDTKEFNQGVVALVKEHKTGAALTAGTLAATVGGLGTSTYYLGKHVGHQQGAIEGKKEGEKHEHKKEEHELLALPPSHETETEEETAPAPTPKPKSDNAGRGVKSWF